MSTHAIEESTTPATASLILAGCVQWSFAVRPHDGFLMGNLVDALVESCGFDYQRGRLTKRYHGVCQCQGCLGSMAVVQIVINDSEHFMVSADVPYADWESHPRIECENELKSVWNAVLADLAKTGVGFDDDIYARIDADEAQR